MCNCYYALFSMTDMLATINDEASACLIEVRGKMGANGIAGISWIVDVDEIICCRNPSGWFGHDEGVR